MNFKDQLASIAPAFSYNDGHLEAGGVNLSEVIEAAKGPVYVYALDSVLENFLGFKEAFSGQPTRICYAMKANDCVAILKLLSDVGSGVDVVSGGELALAMSAGIPADKIVFSGVGKSDSELAQALNAGVMQINVETPYELGQLAKIANSMGKEAPIALRVNPDVEAGTLDQISTGRATDKFGVAYQDAARLYMEAEKTPGLAPKGIAMHIGSQIGDTDFLAAACAKLRSLWESLATSGVKLERFDVGGGLGIRYKNEDPPLVQAYADTIKKAVSGLNAEVVLEPGRRIVGPAGVLLSTVISVKEAAGRRFVILDAAMNDLIRPALYKAWHEIVPLTDPGKVQWTPADVVGPVCESTDKFADQRPLPPLLPGDRVAFLAAGAYGAVMGSEYNSRPRAAEAVVRGGNWSFTRNPRSYNDIIREQHAPSWL
jgi:diaminopimelate decarboxylase